MAGVTAISRWRLLAYGALAVPLGCVMMPLYVYLPIYYVNHYGVRLEAIGLMLVMARLIDTLQAPFFGWMVDRYAAQPEHLRDIVMVSGPFMAGGLVLLLLPPTETAPGYAVWFGLGMVLIFAAYTLVRLVYQSMATAMTLDYTQQARINGAREACGLAGAAMGAVLPLLFVPLMGEKNALLALSLFLLPLMMGMAFLTSRYAPPMHPLSYSGKLTRLDTAMRSTLRGPNFQRLMMVYWVNGVAVVIPLVLLLFYSDKVLHAPGLAGYFLAVYLFSGALGMRLWVVLARRAGKKRAWLAAMGISIAALFSMSFLQPGDVAAFYLICAVLGVCLGADLALPPALLADTLGGDSRSGKQFGMLAFFGKLALALGGGTGLILLGLSGYGRETVPENQQVIAMLSFLYVLLPCAIRTRAMYLLSRSHLDERKILTGESAGHAASA